MSASDPFSNRSPMSVGEGFGGIDVSVDRRLGDLRDRVAGWRVAGESIALVPTAGQLHAGHNLLIKAARHVATHVVVALLPAPSRVMGDGEAAVDPASEIADLRRVSQAGASSCWAPPLDQMVPSGVDTRVRAGSLAEPMEGIHRREALDWMTTALTKLIIQAEPDVVVFADREYQLLLIMARIAADLDLPVQVAAAATAREPDGLVMAAANGRLDPEARVIAGVLPKTLFRMVGRLTDGASTPEAEIAWGRDQLMTAGITAVDYLDVRDPRTLEPVIASGAPARVFVAVRLGGVRLVDSMAVG